MGLDHTGPFTHDFFFINIAQYCTFIFTYDFLDKFYFSLAYFIVRIQSIIHVTNKICFFLTAYVITKASDQQ